MLNQNINISAAIVLYNEEEEELLQAINSFLSSKLTKKLFLVDNSTSKFTNATILNHPDVVYIFNNRNLGFGRANNLVIDSIKDVSEFHLILNPDTKFDPNILDELTTELIKNEDLALITPAIKFPDGSHQYSVRKYPSFFDLIIRKLGVFKSRIHNKEYRDIDLSQPFYPDAVHGSFMLFKTEDFVAVDGFDERYFLYLEDIDICKKIDTLGKKKLFYPKVTVTHALKKESSKKLKLFFYHFSSAIQYFLKWL
ncbi:glycosyltransferase family 2 protein [Tenacibaculum sp. 190524A05c]|uniref:glycosyltransferase family 2 protein n=1 Tax=Tenacibaculum platacis TaxID=3137852 RepID=UPI0032B252BC